jgi:anti-sigma B factor antagonist
MTDTATGQIHERALATRTEDGCTVAVLSGALDLTATPALREQLRRLLGPAASRLVLDLSLVSDIDASGLAVLVGTWRRARLIGGYLRLAAVSPAVSAALSAADLDRLFEIFPTVRAAISAPPPARPTSTLSEQSTGDPPLPRP